MSQPPDDATVERTAALHALRALAPLGAIDAARMDALLSHVRFRRLDAGDVLFRTGERSDTLFVVVAGELALSLPLGTDAGTDAAAEPDAAATAPVGVLLQRRRAGDTAGDFAVLSAASHLVDAAATLPTLVATFPRDAFEALTDLDPSVLAHVYDSAAELSRRVTLARLYTELFGRLDAPRMAKLLAATHLRRLAAGETLLEQGSTSDGLHLVVAGRLVVERETEDGTLSRLAELREAGVVGELSLLSGEPRSATVVAARPSTVAHLPQADFGSIVATDPALIGSLARLVVRRQLRVLRSPSRRPERLPDRVFAVVPLDAPGPAGLPVHRTLVRLQAAFATLGPTLALDAGTFDTLYGERGASTTPGDSIFDSAIGEWLNDREQRHDATLLVADPALTAWTRRVCERADRVLLLADAGAPPGLRDVELAIGRGMDGRRFPPRIELVLVHPVGTRAPAGTASWLDARRLDDFHHVRLDAQAHFRRLARRLAGRARGLVFSGGGARGYAHLGVQRLVEEHGVEFDCIGGSSMGALLGAKMASGGTWRETTALSARFASKRALFDYTLPLVSLMKSAKLERFCREVYGDVRAEDLWTPFFAVSSNLADGTSVVHDRGALADIVRATISLPGLFSPVPREDGALLIDGAVLDNFPVARMLDRLGGRGEIVGVNVGRAPERFERYEFGTSLSGWRVLWSRLWPWTKRIAVPRVAETLLRSADVKDLVRQEEARALCDVLVEPDVAAWSLLDFKHHAAIAQVGHDAALQAFRACGLVSAGPAPAPGSRDQDTVDVPPAASAPTAAATTASSPGVAPSRFAAPGSAPVASSNRTMASRS